LSLSDAVALTPTEVRWWLAKVHFMSLFIYSFDRSIINLFL